MKSWILLCGLFLLLSEKGFCDYREYEEEAKSYALLDIPKLEEVGLSAEQCIHSEESPPISSQRRLVFISFSQSASVLENIIKQAKIYGFTPVLRGFKDRSYIKTAEFLAKIIEKADYGVLIDPESFKEFNVRAVPTFVVSGVGGGYNKVSGNVSFEYVLNLFGEKR